MSWMVRLFLAIFCLFTFSCSGKKNSTSVNLTIPNANRFSATMIKKPSSASSKNQQLNPGAVSVKSMTHLIVNIRTNSDFKVIHWDACTNVQSDSNEDSQLSDCDPGAVQTQNISINIPNMQLGEIANIQVLGVLEASNDSFGFVYADASGKIKKDVAFNLQPTDIVDSSVAQSLKTAQLMGRYIAADGSSPTGRINVMYQPEGANKDPMVIETQDMVAGWTNLFLISGVDFRYRLLVDGLPPVDLAGGTINFDSPKVSPSDRILSVLFPENYFEVRFENGIATNDADSEDGLNDLMRFGFFGPGALSKTVCYENSVVDLGVTQSFGRGLYSEKEAQNALFWDPNSTTRQSDRIGHLGGVATCTGAEFEGHLKFSPDRLGDRGEQAAVGFDGVFKIFQGSGGYWTFLDVTVGDGLIQTQWELLPGAAEAIEAFDIFLLGPMDHGQEDKLHRMQAEACNYINNQVENPVSEYTVLAKKTGVSPLQSGADIDFTGTLSKSDDGNKERIMVCSKMPGGYYSARFQMNHVDNSSHNGGPGSGGPHIAGGGDPHHVEIQALSNVGPGQCLPVYFGIKNENGGHTTEDSTRTISISSHADMTLHYDPGCGDSGLSNPYPLPSNPGFGGGHFYFKFAAGITTGDYQLSATYLGEIDDHNFSVNIPGLANSYSFREGPGDEGCRMLETTVLDSNQRPTNDGTHGFSIVLPNSEAVTFYSDSCGGTVLSPANITIGPNDYRKRVFVKRDSGEPSDVDFRLDYTDSAVVNFPGNITVTLGGFGSGGHIPGELDDGVQVAEFKSGGQPSPFPANLDRGVFSNCYPLQIIDVSGEGADPSNNGDYKIKVFNDNTSNPVGLHDDPSCSSGDKFDTLLSLSAGTSDPYYADLTAIANGSNLVIELYDDSDTFEDTYTLQVMGSAGQPKLVLIEAESSAPPGNPIFFPGYVNENECREFRVMYLDSNGDPADADQPYSISLSSTGPGALSFQSGCPSGGADNDLSIAAGEDFSTDSVFVKFPAQTGSYAINGTSSITVDSIFTEMLYKVRDAYVPAEGPQTKAGQIATDGKLFTFSTWFKPSDVGAVQYFLHSESDTINYTSIAYLPGGAIQFRDVIGGGDDADYTTQRSFIDYSAWYHLVVSYNSVIGSVSIYINGELQTYSSSIGPTTSNRVTELNDNTNALYIGSSSASSSRFYGALADTYLIDGADEDANAFGEPGGIFSWNPKQFSGSPGQNGLHLEFDPAGLGDDSFAIEDVTGSSAGGSLHEGPHENHMNLGPQLSSIDVIKYANRAAFSSTCNGTAAGLAYSANALPQTGKWYFEVKYVTSGGVDDVSIGLGPLGISNINTSAIGFYGVNALAYLFSGSAAGAGGGAVTFTGNDQMNFAYDADNGDLWIKKNGDSWIGGGDPTTPSTPTLSGLGKNLHAVAQVICASGQTFAGVEFNFGQIDFSQAPPSGFMALKLMDMQQSQPRPDDYFFSMAYGGSGVDHGIPLGPLDANMAMIKNRDSAANPFVVSDHLLGTSPFLDYFPLDGSIAANNSIFSIDNVLKSLEIMGSDPVTNTSGDGYLAWLFRDDINAGIDIVSYTGDDSGNHVVAHDLAKTPEMFWIKGKDAATDWSVYHAHMPSAGGNKLFLNNSNALAAGSWGSSPPDASNISLNGDSSVNASGTDYQAYIFTSKEGISKFGKYTGNGVSQAIFIPTGFKPSIVVIKKADDTLTGSWMSFDDNFDPSPQHVHDKYLRLDSGDAATTLSGGIRFLSNGISIESTDISINGGGKEYIYFIFSQKRQSNSLGH